MKKILILVFIILIIIIATLFFTKNKTSNLITTTPSITYTGVVYMEGIELAQGWKTYQNNQFYFKDGKKYTGILNDEYLIDGVIQNQAIETKVEDIITGPDQGLINYNLPLSKLIESYLNQEGLASSQVAFSYYNITNSNQIDFNETQMMTLGSTYKLPLNMLVTDKINQGIFKENQIVSIRTLDNREDEEYSDFISEYGESTSIKTLQKTSLVLSNNISSESLMMLLGGWTNTMNQIKKYGFYISSTDNISSTSHFLSGLKYLYNHSNEYQDIINYMLMANPNEYYKNLNKDTEIAHKYGLYDDAMNDIAIVYSKKPYLIALFTSNLTYTQFCDITKLIHQWHLHNE